MDEDAPDYNYNDVDEDVRYMEDRFDLIYSYG